MAATPTLSACGVEISLRIGQRVRHRDYLGRRVTGIVNGLHVESEQGLTASVILDEPIIIPARCEGDREVHINWQTCPVTEFSPFDDRDEQIAELLESLKELVDKTVEHDDEVGSDCPICIAVEHSLAVIAKIEGPHHG